jgi:hypothetical protein
VQHIAVDSAEIRGVADRRVHQGQERTYLNGPRQRPVLPLSSVHMLKPPALPGGMFTFLDKTIKDFAFGK